MNNYLVTWTIDIDADTPEQAAVLALMIQRDASGEATYFTVKDKERGNETEVNLDAALYNPILADPTLTVDAVYERLKEGEES